MTGTPSRAALAARNGSARVAALPRPARRDQQPAAGRRRRGPYRHRAELWPALRHRDRGTRDRPPPPPPPPGRRERVQLGWGPSPAHPGATSPPPLAADAAVHTGTVPSSGQRCVPATAAPAIADTAAATGPELGTVPVWTAA